MLSFLSESTTYLFFGGVVGGILAGTLGIGGGVIFVAIFTVYLEQRVASSYELVRLTIANSIFATLFASLSASLKQKQQGTFYLREVAWVAVPGAIAAVGASYLLTSFSWYSRSMFSGFFLLFICWMAYSMFKPAKAKIGSNEVEEVASTHLMLSGAGAGLVAALSGLGGGVLLIPLFTEWFGWPIRKAASVSLGSIFLFSVGMSVFYYTLATDRLGLEGAFGYLYLPMSLPVALGVIIGAPIGVKLATRVPERILKLLFGILLLLVAGKLLYSIVQA